MWYLSLLFLPLVFLTFLWLLYQWKDRRLLAVASSLPTAYPRRFLLGTWYSPVENIPVYNVETFTKYLVEGMVIAAQKSLDVYCNWIGPIGMVYLQNPVDLQVILNSSKALNKGVEYNFLRFIFGQGLLTAPGPRWKTSRRVISPLFHARNIQNLMPVFNKNSILLVDNLEKCVNCGPVQIFGQTMEVALRSVCAILFGGDIMGEMDNATFDFAIKYIKTAMSLIKARTFRPWLWSEGIFNLIYKRELNELSKTWDGFITPPMEKLKRKTAVTRDSEPNVDQTNDQDSILQEGNIPQATLVEELIGTVTNEELNCEIRTILGTGSDTSAVTICSCLMALGNNPGIQEKLYDEIVSVVGKEQQYVTAEDLTKLVYLDCVIKETMRVFMVVPIITRTLTEDIQITKCTLPKGGRVYLGLAGIHYNPDVYPSPHIFDPDRFAADNSAKRHPYSFIPFGGGPRNCVGKHYAYTSLKIMMIYLLKAYKIKCNVKIEDLTYDYVITLNSSQGYLIELEKRH